MDSSHFSCCFAAVGLSNPEATLERAPQRPTDMSCFRDAPLLHQTRDPSGVLLPFLGGEGSPTKIDYRKKSGTLIVNTLEDLVNIDFGFSQEGAGLLFGGAESPAAPAHARAGHRQEHGRARRYLRQSVTHAEVA